MEKFTGAPFEQVVAKMSGGHVSTMHGQQVAVTMSSARKPVGPATVMPGALVTWKSSVFTPAGRLLNVKAVQAE